mgnify:CR=1 FL=1
MPRRAAEPYDVSQDADGNIWVADVGGTAASLYRFNPRDQSFTLYPKPQTHGGHAEDSDHQGRRHLGMRRAAARMRPRSGCSIRTWTRSRTSARSTRTGRLDIHSSRECQRAPSRGRT